MKSGQKPPADTTEARGSEARNTAKILGVMPLCTLLRMNAVRCLVEHVVYSGGMLPFAAKKGAQVQTLIAAPAEESQGLTS